MRNHGGDVIGIYKGDRNTPPYIAACGIVIFAYRGQKIIRED